MSEVKNDGGPASPQERISHMEAMAAGPGRPVVAVPHYVLDGGMSLRDWFAGQMLPRIGAGWPNEENKALLAARCYEMADAMLAARSK